jgi:NitT/TauT family transport system permease protein
MKWIVPIALGLTLLGFWEFVVAHYQIAPYILPAPSAIWAAFVENFSSLLASLWITLSITIIAFVFAVAGGVALAVLFTQSRSVEFALYPYAVILQVTPVVAIAPLILIWVGFERVQVALVMIAWIVAFFPILSGTTQGLKSADHNLIDLFRLHGASRWKILKGFNYPRPCQTFSRQ